MQGTFGSARDIGTDNRSTLVAMNVTNHKVAWRRLLDNRCAGTITTAGGLIFAGRFNGQLTALNSDTGQRLWSFQTDGGFTTTATTFEHEGVQYLAGIAGGGVTGGRLNDGLWLFSLNGTIESLPPGSGDPPPDDGDGDDETQRSAGVSRRPRSRAHGQLARAQRSTRRSVRPVMARWARADISACRSRRSSRSSTSS